ncbi:precorrin-3B synthase [Streptomyces sp. NPDC001922]|uniref:precorrin-3B synthase n=1 Tax=Streptomyces sp. NPDC001922 TaxID=3364624 RepID=UPI00369E88CA
MPLTPATSARRAGPPARGGGDACPGALRLHTADDGSLARIRLPAGLLTCRQLDVLAQVSEELGDGNLDLTSRGNVQLRGLAADDGAELARRLRDAELLPSERHERVRNIVASPLSGLDGAGHADVRPWVRELDDRVCANPDTAMLSGRFLFAVDDGRGDVAALGPDVTLIAAEHGSAVLHLDGDGPGLRIAAADGPRAAVLAAEEFLDAAGAAGGRVWRVRELPPADALPARVHGRLAREGIDAQPVEEPPAHGAPPATGVIHGPDGRCSLSVLAPLGRLSAAQWRLLGVTAARGGPAEARVTPWRGIVLPGLPPGAAAAGLDALEQAGFVTGPGSPWQGVGACTGRPGCAKSLADVRADAAAAVAGSGSGNPGRLPVYWSGCERRCGHPQGHWVDVLATGSGYRVTVRGGPAGGTGTEAAADQTAGAVAAARGTT